MFDHDVGIEEQFRKGLQVVLTGLDGREQLTGADIDSLRRELEALAGEGRVQLTSDEQLKAEGIIAWAFRPTVEECLQLWFGKSAQTDIDIWQHFGEDVARASETEGTVLIRALVGKDGRVKDWVVIEGPAVLVDAAVVSARSAVFRPALLRHRPVEVWVMLPITFRLR